jgi:hypothetical protein
MISRSVFINSSVVGHFNKLKQTKIGEKFIVRGKNWLSREKPMTDIETRLPVSDFTAGKEWVVTDVSIDEKYYNLCYILENKQGEKITFPTYNEYSENWVVKSSLADLYKKRYGVDVFNDAINGYVKIGMPKEMCELSWGKPNKINSTVNVGGVSEQWVYDDNYLYFENGKLTAKQ